MIYLILLFTTALTYAYQCDIAGPDQIVLNTFGKTKACLKSLAYAPTTPEFPKLYFQKIGDQVDFTFFCHTDDKVHSRILFLEDDGIKSLKLPIYYYMIGIDHTDLPRNVLHFKYNKLDLYAQFEYRDVATIITADKLPAVSEDIMVSMTKIKSEYINKYEAWLKTQKKESATTVSVPDEAEMKILTTCLEQKQQDVVNTYLQQKFSPHIPAYGTMVTDSRSRDTLSPAQKAKYQRPWSEIEAEYLADIVKTHSDCEGIVSEESVRKAFDKSYGKNKTPYEALRRYLFQ